MKTTFKLSFMMFVEWFIWGAWFVPLWLWLNKSGFSAGEIGWSYACTAIAAILSPILVGSVTDRFFSAQKVLAVLMFAGAVLMYFAAQQTTFAGFFPLLLAYSLTYMPTIALTNSIAFANGYLTEVGMKNATGWMTLGQFSEIFFMLALPFFTKRFGIKKVLLLGLITAAIRYGFFVYGGAETYFTYALLFLGILLHGVSYDFYYVTAYIYVDKKAPVHMRTAAQGLITLCCQGFGSLLGYRLGGVMMEKMFAYPQPVNGLTFNWAGMWTFGAVMIAVIALLFMIFFRESDKEITAIDDRDIALTQGEVK